MFGLFGFTSTSAIGIATDAVSDAAFVSTPVRSAKHIPRTVGRRHRCTAFSCAVLI
jgi:hypothetical protein